MRLRGTGGLATIAVVAAATTTGALAPSPALAARDLSGVPANLTEQASSPDFVVHYTSTPGDPSAIAPDAAQQLLSTAERALGDTTSRLDLPVPLNDGDGRSDVYVYPTSDASERGLVRGDSRADRTTGWMGIPPDATGDIVTVAHQVVHLQQLALYRPAGRVLAEGSATWAPLHLYASELGRLPDHAQFFPDDPLDCDDPARCTRPGRGAWQFFELLAERFGPRTVRALYDRSSTLGASDHRPHFREALDDVLAGSQTTLAATFAEFTAANLVGDYALQGLARRRYGATEPYDDLATGSRTRRFRARVVKLDHLSAAFYRLRSGSDAAASRRPICRRARLRVTIDGPADLEEPLFWAPFRPHGDVRPAPLVKGRTTIERPWTTCTGRELGVALQNPSGTVDARRFRLRVELTVARR